MERELHFKVFDESVADLDAFKKKHGFKTDYDAVVAMIGMVISMDKDENFDLSFLQNGSIAISAKTKTITFASQP